MNVLKLSSTLLLSLLLGCHAVVDGQCADGYEVCKGACVPAGACGMLLSGSSCPKAKPAATAEPEEDDPPEIESAPCGDVSSDPLNCGACGNVCATAMCAEGVCQGGARNGDVVLIGHDFVGASPKLAMSDVLVNAVFMRSRNPVRVLTWEQNADPAAISSVSRVLSAEAKRSGRRHVKSSVFTAEELAAEARVESYDVVLLFDQPNAAPGELAAQGEKLRAPLLAFAENGGVVVVLDGGRGVAEMPELLAAAGIAAITKQIDATGSMLDVVAPSDVVGSGVTAPYKAKGSTVALTIGDPFAAFTTVVAQPETGAPIVLHRIVGRK